MLLSAGITPWTCLPGECGFPMQQPQQVYAHPAAWALPDCHDEQLRAASARWLYGCGSWEQLPENGRGSLATAATQARRRSLH